MNRIEKKFKELRSNKEKALIAFITAGYPNLRVTEQLIYELSQSKVDIIELGVPFSDPMADGPVIQEASQFALEKGIRLIDILRLVKRVRRNVDTPICLMTYYNPIFCFPESSFVKMARECFVDGVIIPDLPFEEAGAFNKLARRYNLDLISFIAPTTSVARIKSIASKTRGFIYYVSLTGTTGARKDLPADIAKNIRAIKKITTKPVCVGFGISNAAQVKEINKIADGAIVGSAIVRKIKENIGKKDLVKKVGSFVRGLHV